MLNHNFLIAITSWLPNFYEVFTTKVKRVWEDQEKRQAILVFLASGFLVSIPVFFQAPLVRLFPWLSLILTVGWIFLSFKLKANPQTYLWGDLLLGFSWSWLAGSIYWGWLRWYPAVHIPVESIALPFVIWSLCRGKDKLGNLFYLGSLLGTAITDLYFYVVGLIPYWRQLMEVNPLLVAPLLQEAIAKVATPWGICWAIVLANLLLGISLYFLQKRKLHYLVFSSAVLTTILTDALFLVVAYFGLN